MLVPPGALVLYLICGVNVPAALVLTTPCSLTVISSELVVVPEGVICVAPTALEKVLDIVVAPAVGAPELVVTSAV